MRLGSARQLITLIWAPVLLIACSSDGDADTTTPTVAATTTIVGAPTTTAGDSLDTQRQAIINRIVADSTTNGYELDAECVTTLVAGLSESDVDILATSATDPSGDPPTSGLSADAQAMDVLSCAVGGADPALAAEAADVAITAVSEGTTQHFDQACVETAFAKLTDDQLNAVIASAPSPTQEDLQPVLYLMIPCLLDGTAATSGS